ncbi:unnamed protein product [Rotaria magnacalcarata]|uniref:Uncharacterized protein n=1 Tax=Rotaria magnacalcarata TaxID=392030 RepID=A0A8S2YZ78_9BILA|nr:unnamed protein product [Rotaria magnacalcarata]
MSTESDNPTFDEEAFVRSIRYQPYNIVIDVYEKYKREHDRLSTLERVLGRTCDELDDEEQGRLTVSDAAIQMIKQYYGVPKKNVMPLLAFRINVPSVLLKSSPPPPSIIKCGRPSLESRAKSNENQSTNTLRTAPTPIPPSSTRLGKVDHWPITTSKGRCRNPGLSGYTRVSCSKCDQRLCLCYDLLSG